MKKYIYGIISFFLVIIIGNYIFKSHVNINFSKKDSNGKLINSYEEIELGNIKDVECIENELYFTKRVFDITKDMKINNGIISDGENTYGRVITIGSKEYGINYKYDKDISFKDIKVKLNKDGLLKEVKDYNSFNNEVINLYENKDFIKEKYLNVEENEKISKKIEEKLKREKAIYSIVEIKNVMYSKKTEFLVMLRCEDKIIVAFLDTKNNNFYIENSIFNYLIKDVFKFNNDIFCISEEGELNKLYIENNKLEIKKISEGIKNGKLLGIKDDFIYIKNNEKLVGFNIKTNELKTIFKDSLADINRYGIEKLNNFYEGYIIFPSGRNKYMIGLLEEDKIVPLVKSVSISDDLSNTYVAYNNEYCIILKNTLDNEGIPKSKVDIYKL